MHSSAYIQGSTIAALATPKGVGALAIVRLSGPAAKAITEKCILKKLDTHPSHKAFRSKFYKEGRVIDDILVLPMWAPNSFTGEDVVEFHCHGSPIVVDTLLQTLLSQDAEIAKPGEFSYRAVLNGKMDVVQAQAVQQIIHAQAEKAHRSAAYLLEGHFSKEITSWQRSLTHIAAILEAWVDFPEEGLEFASLDSLIGDIEAILLAIKKHLASWRDRKKLEQGTRLCLCGAPNVGKSSLLNTLLAEERAIVSSIAGTTRDVIEERFSVGGHLFVVSDTAGIRLTEDGIEQAGINLSKKKISQADLALFLLDASNGISDEERDLLLTLNKDSTWVVWNKIDLMEKTPLETFPFPTYFISTQERLGLDTLKEALASFAAEDFSGEGEILSLDLAQKQALLEAQKELGEVILGLKSDLSPEFLAFHIKHALKALNIVAGKDINEEILTSLFQTFCVGK